MVREVRGSLRAVPCRTLAGARDAMDQLGTRPAGVIIDVRLPDGSGLDLVSEIRERFPEIRVLVVTGRADPDVINRSHLLDAAFALKPHTIENLRAFLRRLAAPRPGRAPLHATIDGLVVRYSLTPRETDILTALAMGEPRATLARTLGLGEESVKTHIKHILRKTRDRDVGELLARLLRTAAGGEQVED